MIERLVVASKNADKIAEMEAVLVGTGLVHEIVRGLDWPDVDETEDTLEGNALLKAHAVHAATGLAAASTPARITAMRSHSCSSSGNWLTS